MTHPRRAPMGAVEGSYDPSKRPASATRKAFDWPKFRAKTEKRRAKFVKLFPDASSNEVNSYAIAGRKARKAYIEARRAS